MMSNHIYITGLFIPAYVVVYAPASILVTGFVYWLLLRHLPLAWMRGSAVFTLLGVVLALPWWDVYAIGKEAGKLCREQAGLHVYRTVEAEGVREYDITFWSKHGFSHIEHFGIGPDKYRKKYRDTLRNSNEVSEEIREFTTRYEAKGQEFRAISKHFGRNAISEVDTQTGEVMSELVTLSIYPAWFDQLLLGLTGTGSGFTPWSCGNEPPPGRTETLGLRDLVLATIKPVDKGETK